MPANAKLGKSSRKKSASFSPAPKRRSFSASAAQYFDLLGDSYRVWKKNISFYASYSTRFLKSFIPENQKVLLIGSISSEILEALKPSVGVGLDISAKLIDEATRSNRSHKIQYFCTAPEDFKSKHQFDYVIVLNVADHAADLLALFDSLKAFVHRDSKIILSTLNPKWYPVIRFCSFIGLRIPDYNRNFMPVRALRAAFEVKGFHTLRVAHRILFPRQMPIVTAIFNQFLARLPLLRSLCMIQYFIARPVPANATEIDSCSVIIPCFNEEKNIATCVQRVPDMGKFTEIIIVNDGSADGTEKVAREIAARDKRVTLITYAKNQGKGAAVQKGIRAAKGDVSMILDADMTVPPEELNDYFDAIAGGAAEFVSGTRFVYSMEKNAMPFMNYFGNIFFSWLVQLITGSPCTDSLCGTKAMRTANFRDLNLEDSAWGDFDLLFHAAKLQLRCVEIPVHYKERIAGASKMKAFRATIAFLVQCLKRWRRID